MYSFPLVTGLGGLEEMQTVIEALRPKQAEHLRLIMPNYSEIPQHMWRVHDSFALTMCPCFACIKAKNTRQENISMHNSC